MSTLYPPYLEGRIPAQQGNTLSIPFKPNTMGNIQITKLELKIKTLSTNTNPFDVETLTSTSIENFVANFSVPGGKLTIGQYYKAQVSEPNGAWSNIGVFKYTQQGTISIEDLLYTDVNEVKTNFIGSYTYDESDKMEKVASYKFDIYKNNQIVETTEWLPHYAVNDTADKSIDEFIPNLDLETKDFYEIQYSIQTINGLSLSTNKYIIYNGSHINIFAPIEVLCNSNYNLGAIDIIFTLKNLAPEQQIAGKFNLYRRSQMNRRWEFVSNILVDKYFELDTKLIVFRDYNVEQGVYYEYALQQTNDNNTVMTTKNPVGGACADFEDAFLWDGERQLCIRYNPKVTKFQTTLLENKLNTIGGQYPVFFRNGNTEYKEFSISGLISLQMDKNSAFEVENVYEPRMDSLIDPHNLTSTNIVQEREFKLKVMNWLNNGQPKIFKSPVEGKYLVRLMNVSFTPEDKLGRMLHTFNAAAYEIGTSEYSNLLQSNFVNGYIEHVNQLKHVSRTLEKNITYDLPQCVYARVVEAPVENTTITLQFSNSDEEQDIKIGSTGYYKIYINDNNPLIKIKSSEQIEFEYAYIKNQTYPIYNNGKEITSISCKQRVQRRQGFGTYNMTEISNILYLRIQAKDIVEVNTIDDIKSIPSILYKINDTYYNHEKYKLSNSSQWYLCQWANIFDLNPERFDDIQLEIDLSTSRRIEYNAKDFGGVFKPPANFLRLGHGLYVDIYFDLPVIEEA